MLIYTLVNQQFAMENHHAISGKTHYFDWAIFTSHVLLPEGSYHLNTMGISYKPDCMVRSSTVVPKICLRLIGILQDGAPQF